MNLTTSTSGGGHSRPRSIGRLALMALLAAGSLATLGAAGGCESWIGRIKSPISGRSVSPEEYGAEVAREKDRLAAEAAEKAAALAAEAERRSADFELAVSRIEGDSRLAVLELRGKYNQDASTARAAADALTASLKRATAALDDQHTAALARFDQERGILGAVLDTAGPLASASGIPLLGSLVGLAGVAFGLTGRKKAADQAYDEGSAAAAKAAAERDQHYDLGAKEAILGEVLRAGLAAMGARTAPAPAPPATAPTV